MKNIKVLLVGQPNTGKSSLLNALVGPKVVVSNYPGTTVEIIKAKKVFNHTKISFFDTPGIYSLSDRSEEEKITEKILFEMNPDRVIIMADAVSLERSLYMILQILEAQMSAIIALNFIEEAAKKGIKVNYQKLEKFLNIPVIPINPLTKKGINELLDVILRPKQVAGQSFEIKYDDHIEEAIKKISSQVKGNLPERFVAIRVLEGDEDFYKYLKDIRVIEEAKQDLKEHPEVAKDISITRYGTASFIAKEVTKIIPLKIERRLEKKIDQIILHKIWGLIATGVSLLFIFGILLYLGNWIQSLLMEWTEKILSSFGKTSPFFSIILVKGLTGLVAGVSIALPYVFLFYLLLGLLEDIGILSRFIFNAESFLRKLGLPGKSFIPLILGFGCTAPAIRATRVLANSKEKFQTASLLAFVPCSSRIAIIMGIVGFYGGVKLAFSVFATLFIAGLIWALVIKKLFCTRIEPLILELPSYRKPLMKNVLAKSWLRMKDFVYVVVPLLAVGGTTYGILEKIGVTGSIIKPLSPITKWLGLPAVVIIPLVFGFLQKDLTGAMLISVLGTNVASVLSPLQLYTFGVASTIGIPCMIALGMLWKEFGLKKSLILTGSSIIYGLLIAGLIRRIIFFL